IERRSYYENMYCWTKENDQEDHD
ncbi:MAG: hypothetical protein PWQ56_100, partial [Patescibacteria group bacterium]|nr:hypothetical protein [Patescibacteria group bacterium]